MNDLVLALVVMAMVYILNDNNVYLKNTNQEE